MADQPCNCPACQTPMVHENFGNVFVDVCDDGCKGLWFEGDELARLDHERKGGGPALKEALAAVAGEQVPRPLNCPRCDVEMDTVDYELHEVVAIDCCPECAGVYLDAGELAIIRSRELTDGEVQKKRGRFRRRLGFRRRRREREEAQRRHSTRVMTSFGTGRPGMPFGGF